MTTDKPREKKDNRKRAVAIGLVGLGIAGLAAASAATLNITSATSNDPVAAGSSVVTFTGPGLEEVDVRITPASAVPTPSPDITNWPADATLKAVVTPQTTGDGSVEGYLQIAVYSTSGVKLASATTAQLTLADGSAQNVDLALEAGKSWSDVLTANTKVSVVFSTTSPA